MLGKLLMLSALCLGAAVAAPEPHDDSLNNYLDLVLDNLQVLLSENGLDPATLPNASVGFSDVVLGVTWHGEATLYDGWLRGMSAIHRTEDANFVRDESDRLSGISCGLGVRTMQGHYTCLAKFMDLGPVADVTLDVNGADISFAAALDRSICRFQVSNLNVDRIGHISVDIKGLGLLNWIFEIVSETVVNVVEIFIRNIFENVMESMVNDALNSVDLGILGPILGCDPVTYQHPKVVPLE